MQVDPVKAIHEFFAEYIGTKPQFFKRKEKKMKLKVEEAFTKGFNNESGINNVFDVYSAAYVLYSLCKWPPLTVAEGNFLDIVDIDVCRIFIPLLFNYLSRNGCKDYEISAFNERIIRKKQKL